METFTRFLYEILGQFFSGIITALKGLGNGIKQILDIQSYKNVVEVYKDDLSMSEWVLVCISILSLLIVLVLIFVLIYLLIRKYLKFRKQAVQQDDLMEEIATLNQKVAQLVKEKEEILAMKVSQLGLKPGESPTEDINTEDQEDSDEAGLGQRFSKLALIDEEYENYKSQDYGNSFTLPELCANFRNFAASKLGLFYKEEMMRIFISGLASTKLVILQGISGTGKTSLAYAWGKFMKHDSCVASVQPSWRDRTDMFRIF